MFTVGYGFVVDYLAEVFRNLRELDYSQKYTGRFELFSDISTRDKDGVQKTFSGMMKLLFPHGEANEEEVDELIDFAIEGRKRVKDQLMRIDPTYSPVKFGYQNLTGGTNQDDASNANSEDKTVNIPLKPKENRIRENQKGISYKELFGDYLKGAKEIKITDPYIRAPFQIRNLTELLEIIADLKEPSEEIKVSLLTAGDDWDVTAQQAGLDAVRNNISQTGIEFHWTFDRTYTIHARHIITDTGWKINLDRGLDIFQNSMRVILISL